MKKLFLISALTLLVGGAMPVFATEIDQDSTGPATTVVTYGVGDSYTVTIPADFKLTGTEATTQSILAKEVFIPSGTTLKVEISSVNYSDSTWNLVDKDDSTNKVPYTIKVDGIAVANDDVILEVEAGDTNGETKELAFQVTNPATKAGTYKDTLSFTVTVD